MERMEKNLTDNLLEAQLKLGYGGRPMSFNYITASLGHLLGCGVEEVPGALERFAEFVRPRLGELSFRPIKDGFCITVPEKGTAFVHEKGPDSGFLPEFVETVRRHGISLEDVLAVFRKYSGNVTVKESGCEDYDYLVYFADGQPDDYRYCLTLEPCLGGGCHVIYHRFIPEDFADLFN